MKKLIFILPLLYYSCTDDIIADIDALQTENAEQDAQIDSLMTALNEQQAYIDSLIGESSINDSLIQEYTDSLNTVQNAYIDSLHNAQQTTLEDLANSALSAGFVETEVFNGTLVEDVWTDLDLSSAVGQKNSLVLIKVVLTASIPSNPAAIFFRTNGDTNSYHTPTEGYFSPSGISAVRVGSYGSGSGQNTEMAMAFTDSEGLIEYEATYTVPVYITVVFYLNQ